MTSRSDSGFTLIELLVVMTILTLVVSLIVGAGPSRSAGADLRITGEALAAALRDARAQAIVENRPVGVVLDVVNRRFGIDGTPLQGLPSVTRLSLLTNRGDVIRQGLGRIHFNPDGSSSGGRIEIEAATRKAAVGVDWLSGQVSVAIRP